MQAFFIVFLLSVTVVEFLATGDRWGYFNFLPSLAKFAPEVMSIGAAGFVIAAGIRTRFRFVRASYWLIFAAAAIVILVGILANSVDAGPVFAGLRTYLRGVPWFFVPAVAMLYGDDLRKQLRWILYIALIQIPVALFQHYQTVSRGHVTGDYISGTVLEAGALSIFLVCCSAVVCALYARKLLPAWQLILLVLAFVIPTTVNETKVTLLLLPVALMIAFAVAAEAGKVFRQVMVAAMILCAAAAIFIPVYDSQISRREYGLTIGEFFGDSRNVERYLIADAGVGERNIGAVGRVDQIVVPTQEIMKDPVRFAFGLGIGNASTSALGDGFVGRYGRLFEPFVNSAYSRFILEIGALGVALVLLFYILIWRDALFVARHDRTIVGAFAAGWVAITAVMIPVTAYAKVEVLPALGFLYWYFSGFVMAARMQLAISTKGSRPVYGGVGVLRAPGPSTAV